MTTRASLPNRRLSITEKVEAGGIRLFVTAGIDPSGGAVREVFFGGTKEGSAMNAIMGDVAVIISVALQHGVPAEALAKSMARIPMEPMRPEDLDGRPVETVPASPIGAALDWLIQINSDTAVERDAAE